MDFFPLEKQINADIRKLEVLFRNDAQQQIELERYRKAKLVLDTEGKMTDLKMFTEEDVFL